MTNYTDAPYSPSRLKFTELTEEERDTLFYLSPIREAVYKCMREACSITWFTQESAFLKADSDKRAEWIFASRLLASYGTSIPQIFHILNSTPPTLQEEELTEKRNELINRLAGTEAGQHWMKCMKAKNGWSYMARFLCGSESRMTSEDKDNFFLMLDQIAIMHELISGRGQKYNLPYRPRLERSVKGFRQYCHNPENAKEILELLHYYIDQKDSPKRSSRPVRAAIDSGALYRPPYDWFNKEFGEVCKNDKSSYNEYTNPDNDSFHKDRLYDIIKERFAKYV